MPRSRKPRVKLTPEQKKQQRKIRAALRAESGVAPGRKKGDASDRPAQLIERTPQHEEQFWAGLRDRMAAMKILNDHRERPYWMSLPSRSGGNPVTEYFPCSSFTRDGRAYYGFLFREHRDKFYEKMRPRGSRKELTS